MSRRSRVLVPEAREALNRFKMEVANELGVPLKFDFGIYNQNNELQYLIEYQGI